MLKALEEAEDPAVVVYLLGNALKKSAETDGGEEFVEVLYYLYRYVHVHLMH